MIGNGVISALFSFYSLFVYVQYFLIFVVNLKIRSLFGLGRSRPTRQRPDGVCELNGGLERCCAFLGNQPRNRSGPTLSTVPHRTVAVRPQVHHHLMTIWRTYGYRPIIIKIKKKTWSLLLKVKVENCWNEKTLTSIIWSYSFVIADTERVQYGGYVDIAKIATSRCPGIIITCHYRDYTLRHMAVLLFYVFILILFR